MTTDANAPLSALTGLRILLVEDTGIVAEELVRVLRLWRCAINGPHASLADGLRAVHDDRSLDGALLDINIRGEYVFPIAEELHRRGLPFIFLSGYTRETIPSVFADRPALEKPFGSKALGDLMLGTFPGAGTKSQDR